MPRKTYLEKLEQSKNHVKTYHCKENDAVIVFEQESGDTGQVLVLTDKNARHAIVIGQKDLKAAMK